MTIRIDLLLVKYQLCRGRSQAQDLIKRGKVLLRGELVLKAGQMVEEDSVSPSDIEVTLPQEDQFVGRGGEKLKKAILALDLSDSINKTVIADIGASTGGFTQYLLSLGAEKIYAVDVGHGQLAPILLEDSRVINMEGVNIKEPLLLPELVDHAVVDLSFISLTKTVANVASLVKVGGSVILLYKPQFEVGRVGLNKKGVVHPPELTLETLNQFLSWVKESSTPPLYLELQKVIPCELKGKNGNQEYFIFYKKLEKCEKKDN